MFVTKKAPSEEQVKHGEGRPNTKQTRHVSMETADLLSASRPGFAMDLVFLFISFLPMPLAVFMITSSTGLLSMLRLQNALDIPVEFEQRLLLLVVTLMAPVTAYLSQVLPTGWLLLFGAAVTAAGSTSQFLSTPSLQIVLFAASTGCGTVLIFHAAYVSLSHQFCRRSAPVCLLLLITLGLVMYSVKPAMNLINTTNYSMTISTITLVGTTCVISAAALIQHRIVVSTDQLNLQEDPAYVDEESNVFHISMALQPGITMSSDVPCLITWVAVFMFWAVGVDLTWLSQRYPRASTSVGSLQCALSLMIWTMSYIINKRDKRHKYDGHVLALGLIGTAGVILAIYPAFINTFHLLFSAAYVAQIMGFADLLFISIPLTRSASSFEDSQMSKTGKFRKSVAHILGQSSIILLISVMFIMYVNPLGYILNILLSMQLEMEHDMIILVVLSSVAICMSLLRPRRTTAMKSLTVV